MKAISLLLTLLFLYSSSLFAQDQGGLDPEKKPIHDKDISLLSPIEIMEDSLVYFADSMYYSAFPESRIEGSYEFIRLIKTLMKTQGTFSYPFNKLKEKIAIIPSPDNAFKIYNWEVIRGTMERRYYGVVQKNDGGYIPLIDASDQIIRGAEDSTFHGTRWLGCLYYNIVAKEIGGQKVYFLLGWNGSATNSERKIIEVFGFDSRGQSQFGAPVFTILDRNNRKQPMRFILEYQKGSKVSMNYDKELDQIVFDHCESQIGDPAKKYTYIPDGTYDGLKWDGQQWMMSENIVQIQELQQGNAPIEKPIK